MLWTHNISHFFVCFSPILLVWMQLYSRWGALCISITSTCLLKPHCITNLMKATSNIWITLFKNCCDSSCVLDKVSCLELSLSYVYSMNKLCDITITVKCRCNRRQYNEMFRSVKLFFGTFPFPYLMCVKTFHFKEFRTFSITN